MDADHTQAKQPTHDDVDRAIAELSSTADSVMDLVAVPLLAEILHDQVDAAPVPVPVPTPMQALADTITTQATKSQAQLTRERLELALLSKKSPTKPQAEPCGLFAQGQGVML